MCLKLFFVMNFVCGVVLCLLLIGGDFVLYAVC